MTTHLTESRDEWLAARIELLEAGKEPTHRGVADRLGLAAAPTFATMALLTATFDGGAPAVLCSTAQGGSPVGGMVAMYMLMSAFHAAPWLRLIADRRGGARRS